MRGCSAKAVALGGGWSSEVLANEELAGLADSVSTSDELREKEGLGDVGELVMVVVGTCHVVQLSVDAWLGVRLPGRRLASGRRLCRSR